MWSWKKLPIFLFIPSAASTHTPTFTPIYNFERSTRDWLFQITFQHSHWTGRIVPLKNESSVIFFRILETQNLYPLSFLKNFQKVLRKTSPMMSFVERNGSATDSTFRNFLKKFRTTIL